MKKKFSITVAFPTYECSESIIYTLNSIYKQTYFKNITEVLVITDGKKIDSNIMNKIDHRKLRVVTHSKRLGQSARINDILKQTKTNLLILVNDDVLLKKDTVEKLYQSYLLNGADLTVGLPKPLKPKDLFPKLLNVGVQLTEQISKKWNSGNNYLSSNGRIMMFSELLINKLKVPRKIWNNDAYIYFFTYFRGLNFTTCRSAVAYYRLPNNYLEYFKQSTKFRKSYAELQTFFGNRLLTLYQVPADIRWKVLLNILFQKPLSTGLYLLVTIIVSFHENITHQEIRTSYWETDKSTKILNDTEILD